MYTSLAPPPIAAVIGDPNSLLYLISLTISAFWDGEDLYTIIECILVNKLAKHRVSSGSLKILGTLWPLIKRATSWSYWFISIDFISCSLSTLHIYICWLKIPQLYPIYLAVSPLSPVSIQTFISAFMNYWMEAATLSWSRSSTPVIPRRL